MFPKDWDKMSRNLHAVYVLHEKLYFLPQQSLASVVSYLHYVGRHLT